VYMQNRRDHPSGTGTIDFPGITILGYAGDGLDAGGALLARAARRALGATQSQSAIRSKHQKAPSEPIA
jgi:hypothetical protein